MWITRKSIFYLSANLESIYYNHPDATVIFRHVMAYCEERMPDLVPAREFRLR